MSGLQVVQRKYADHWPIWCVVDDDTVILCRETEQEAKAEANAKRSEATKERPRNEDGTLASSAPTVSGQTGSSNSTAKAKASASGTNRGAVEKGIRLRAERKVGQKLAEMPKAKGAANGNAGPGRGNKTRCDNVTAFSDTPTLSEIGITKRQSSDWQNMRGAK